MITKHQKPSRVDAGGIVKKEAKIQLSNIAYLDPIKKIATKLSIPQGAGKMKLVEDRNAIDDLAKYVRYNSVIKLFFVFQKSYAMNTNIA